MSMMQACIMWLRATLVETAVGQPARRTARKTSRWQVSLTMGSTFIMSVDNPSKNRRWATTRTDWGAMGVQKEDDDKEGVMGYNFTRVMVRAGGWHELRS